MAVLTMRAKRIGAIVGVFEAIGRARSSSTRPSSSSVRVWRVTRKMFITAIAIRYHRRVS
ncbi:MAG: hypothetical protein BWY50_01858 [Spirochaetes bacterium ADurb.Bin315]|nr:MAG: hypothetical protein BWY50_01858 [Spirochaetes bacterium ADurb.Bin315]